MKYQNKIFNPFQPLLFEFEFEETNTVLAIHQLTFVG